ncbi:MAG TPA: hypothetical protein VFA80_15105 [Xanthobacteraceae bacterium]|nr:hypothetical protein [Xanthobacteraceae bacterium]
MLIIGGINKEMTRQPLPKAIEKLFAAADVSIPAQGKLSIQDVDRALAGLSISDRLHQKCKLRELGYIA